MFSSFFCRMSMALYWYLRLEGGDKVDLHLHQGICRVILEDHENGVVSTSEGGVVSYFYSFWITKIIIIFFEIKTNL